MKTRLFTIIFVLAVIVTANAQTQKPKQTTVKKITTQTSQKKQTKNIAAKKTSIPDVKIVTGEDYDEFEDEYYTTYFIADNKTGEIIKELFYDKVNEFSEGLALVKEYYNGYGFVDKTGKEVIVPKFYDAKDFHQGLAAVKQDEKWGYIDKTGNEIISFKYDDAESFSNGKAKVTLNGKIFYIDKTGKKIK